jgi:hypothetical protein
VQEVGTAEAGPADDDKVWLVVTALDREFLPEPIEQIEVLARLYRAHGQHEGPPAEIPQALRASRLGDRRDVGAELDDDDLAGVDRRCRLQEIITGRAAVSVARKSR